MNRFEISAGVLLSSLIGTTPAGWTITNIGSFDVYPGQTTKILAPNLINRISIWDTTTMTSTVVSGQTFGSRGLICSSSTLCIITSETSGGNNYLYTFNPSLLPTLTLTAVFTSRPVLLSYGRGPMILVAQNIGLLFILETTQMTVFKTSDLSTVFMSWPSATNYYVSDVFCTTTQCWNAMTQYFQPRIRSILMPSTLQEGFLGNSIPNNWDPATTFIRAFRYFNSENLIALGNSNYNDVYFYEKYPCHSECSLCIEGLNSNCTACTAPKILSNGYCCDPSCATCSGSLSTQCTSCPATAGVYFRPLTATCGSCTDPGFFISGVNCLQCHTSCATCDTNSTHCLTCNPSTNYIHIYDGNVCNSTCDTANGRYVTTWSGQNACQKCDASCLTCSGAGPNACTSCDTGKALYADGSCGVCKTGSGGEYSYLVSSVLSCKACASPCATCTGTSSSIQTCITCIPGLFLNPDGTCSTCTTPGFYTYSNAGQDSCGTCSAPCSTCVGTALSCTSCSPGLFLEQSNSCSSCTNILNYQYNEAGVDKCGICDASCSGCTTTSTNCLACVAGAEIVSTLPGPCRLMTFINLVITVAEDCGDNYQKFCYWIEPSVPVPTPVLEDLIRLGNIRSSVTKDKYSDSRLVESQLTLSIASENKILAKVSMINIVEQEYFTISLILDKDSELINYNGRQFQYLHSSTSFEVHQSMKEGNIALAKNLGLAVSGLANLNPTGGNAAGETIGFMATIDPSGFITRFFQAIKIVSRLAYFDFVYGPGLSLFLESADSASGVDKVSKDREMLTRRAGTRSKLTRYKVGVEVMNTIYTWKSASYSISMLISIFVQYIQHKRIRLGLTSLWLIYLWPRVHIILMNFTIVDICFMGTRIFLHSNKPWEVVFSGVMLMFIAVDICRIMGLAMDDHIWSEIYREVLEEKEKLLLKTKRKADKLSDNNTKQAQIIPAISSRTSSKHVISSSIFTMGDIFKNKLNQTNGSKSGSIHLVPSGKRLLATRHVVPHNNGPLSSADHKPRSSHLFSGFAFQKPAFINVKEGHSANVGSSKYTRVNLKSTQPNELDSRIHIPQVDAQTPPACLAIDTNRIIDYERTYDELELNHHLVSVSSSSLMISQKVYMSAACRLHLTVHSFRVGFYQFFMVAGQGCPRLMACCILVLELAKIIRSIYLYCKLKYLKSKVLLAIDLSQSLYMAVFFSIFLFAPLREDYVPAAGLQNLAMWLVVLTCLTEYILLGAFLLISAIDLVKKLWLVRDLKQKGLYVEPPHSFLRYQEAGSFRSPANNFIKSSAREGTRGNGTSNDIHEGASSKGSRTKFTSIQQAKVAPININNEDNPSQDGKESVASSHKKDHLISNAKNLGSNNLIPTVSVHSKPRKSIQIADSSERVVIVHSNQVKQSTSSPSHSPVIKPKIIVPKAKQQPNPSSTVMKLSQDSVEDPGHKSPQDSHSPTVQKAFFPESEAFDNGKNAGMGYNSGAISTYPLDNPDALHPEKLDRRGSTYKFRRSSQMLKEANPVDMEDRRPSN